MPVKTSRTKYQHLIVKTGILDESEIEFILGNNEDLRELIASECESLIWELEVEDDDT